MTTNPLLADQNGVNPDGTNQNGAANGSSKHWDIFCLVVDNYGDIGVTWRLAKQLANEHKIKVNLWVDDLNSFAHILPELTPSRAKQSFNGVTIYKWDETNLAPFTPGSVLVEAFACELPNAVKDKLNQHKQTFGTQPVWINLEYLCAEDWVEGCHALPSMQSNGLQKWFYFPGFTTKTGGLICESNLLETCEQWQSDASNKLALLNEFGITGIKANDYFISLFSYENNTISALLNHYASKPEQATHVLVPQGRSVASVEQYLQAECGLTYATLTLGKPVTIGQITLHLLPMTNQESYDKLLWSCDLNIVRGEDSFLRAQWAQRPFIWHIYPQDEDYHLVKLNAFLAHYCKDWPQDVAEHYVELVNGFNVYNAQQVACELQAFDDQLEFIEQMAKIWPQSAINDTDLVSRLVQFVKSR
ncbi:elongation factor P maturation arginine rhamnosyltransferase EarP [Shewanella maritima]|uniref:Protein-arginine rhamnosyltransferase n=1 Tax=Shewanella maritima TaxID=2520507 RepID=A0A411PM77_9GAMM|nr:elongation factor P maturation arginine rhamnosyltransferase EarP [Shewanella maritima]QBF84624.1 elongation factor P maturation arginine rhamnosyltransferase EarP [Shewanella maritima]